VIQTEIIAAHDWRDEVSVDGVKSYVTRLRSNAPTGPSGPRVRIYFEDEAPAIGSGWRIVTAEIDDKRVRLADHFGRTAEVKLATYHALRAQPFAGEVQ
jgi:hypothetical protein